MDIICLSKRNLQAGAQNMKAMHGYMKYFLHIENSYTNI